MSLRSPGASAPTAATARAKPPSVTAFILIACGISMAGAACMGRGASVTLAGSTAFQPFAENLAEAFNAAHPDVNVTVQGGGSAVGISAALNGAAQIGMADLVELPADAKNLTAFVVARDGIAVVVNPSNEVGDLPMSRIRDVYLGKVRNWKELGGADAPITVVSRESGSGTRSSFETILGRFDLSTSAIIQDSNGTVRETVANDANAIGYLSYGLLNEKIKAVTVDGQKCTTELILAGKYVLVRPIYLLTLGEPAGNSKAFIDFVLGAEGQASIKADGLLPAQISRGASSSRDGAK
jgi:phosphate transport system substrate-binding protein